MILNFYNAGRMQIHDYHNKILPLGSLKLFIGLNQKKENSFNLIRIGLGRDYETNRNGVLVPNLISTASINIPAWPESGRGEAKYWGDLRKIRRIVGASGLYRQLAWEMIEDLNEVVCIESPTTRLFITETSLTHPRNPQLDQVVDSVRRVNHDIDQVFINAVKLVKRRLGYGVALTNNGQVVHQF